METAPTTRLAVYLDFENLVASQYDHVHGKGKWNADRAARGYPKEIKEKLRAATIDVESIIDYAASVGIVTICRAYANWSAGAFGDYGPVLTGRSVDLVQIFPLTGSKNGADIRLATDVIDDLAHYPHLTHVLVAAGDSDYLAVAQKARRLGKQVLGVGVRGSIGKYWEAACDEFKRYDTLARVGGRSAEIEGGAPAEPADLMMRALRLSEQQEGTERVKLSTVKQVMRRISPGFDEQELGFKNFSGFVLGQPTLVSMNEAKTEVWANRSDEAEPDAVQPAEVSPAAVLRGKLPYISPSVWPLGDGVVAEAIIATRMLDDLLANGEHHQTPHEVWQERLQAEGMSKAAATTARSFATQILRAATRGGDGLVSYNAELAGLGDEVLRTRLFEQIALAMHIRFVEAEPATIAEAIHGPHPTVAQVELCRRAVAAFDLALEAGERADQQGREPAAEG